MFIVYLRHYILKCPLLPLYHITMDVIYNNIDDSLYIVHNFFEYKCIIMWNAVK